MHLITSPADIVTYGIPEDQPLPPEDRAGLQSVPATSIDELYRAQAPHLLRYFKRSTGNPHTAADLVQDVFARLSGSGRLAEILNPAAYLQRIARNLLVDRARRPAAREAFVSLQEWDGVSLPAQEDALLAEDLLRCYESAIAALPERTRMIFLLQRADDLTYRQIAARLGVTVFTVEYHMKQALKHLDRSLDHA